VVWENGSKKNADVTASNGRETVNYMSGNAQVNIGDNGPKSGVHFGVAGLDDFCHWPGWGGKVVGRANGRVTLEQKSGDHLARIVADEATGFVYRESSGWLSTGSGQDHWQFAPRVTAKGAIVPGLSVEHIYQKDSTSVVWVKTIESIDLHSPIPPETFLVAVPPGTLFLDYREGRDDTYRGVARWPITDVVAHADADPRRFKPFVPPIKVGQTAPPIDPLEWLDPAGKAPAPSLAGKVVLVDFWGIECGPCIAQLPEVREAAGHFAGKGLVIIGLHDSSGTPEKVTEFARKRGLSWTLAIDRPGEGFGATFAAYGVRAIPSAAVLDRQGKLAYLGDFRAALATAAGLLEKE
jgi:thiol-disulfide isomerase/thioredoxin